MPRASASADQLARKHHARLARLPEDLLIGDPGPTSMFDDRLYKRGALTLHALRLLLGDDDFFGVLREWTTTHRHATATTADFIDLVDDADRARTSARSSRRGSTAPSCRPLPPPRGGHGRGTGPTTATLTRQPSIRRSTIR